MKHQTYKLKRGDTLESIARELGISPEEIRSFHNRYCEMQDLMGPQIPRHLTRIIIPGNHSGQSSGEKLPVTLSLGEASRYKIGIQNSFYLKGEPMNQNTTENIWEIHEDSAARSLSVQVTDKKILKYDPQLKQLMDIISKINEASDHLHLQFNKEKTIWEVLNKQEIWNRWEKIKFEEIKLPEMQDEYLQMIVKQYDEVFQNIQKNTAENILYQLLFLQVSTITCPVEYPRRLVKDRRVNSLIFPMKYIFYDLNYKSYWENEQLIVSVHSEVRPDTLIQSFGEEYKKGYSSFVDSPFSFGFTIEGKYAYDKETGILLDALIYIKEQASREVFYLAKYRFSLLKEEHEEVRS